LKEEQKRCEEDQALADCDWVKEDDDEVIKQFARVGDCGH